MNRHSLLILCLVVAVDSACFGLLLPVLPFFVGDLIGNFNAIAITQVTAVYAGCQLVGAPLIGRWSDRLGRKPLLASSIGIWKHCPTWGRPRIQPHNPDGLPRP